MNEYPLSPKSTMPELIEVLKQLHKDALSKAEPLAMRYTQHGEESKRADAMHYIGQADILKSLLWALDGTAIDNGFDNPTVEIQ
jgi:hypothetical protein